MKKQFLLKTGFISLVAIGSLSSFLYLNTVKNPGDATQSLEYCEAQIIDNLDRLEQKKSLPEAFILEKLIEMGKNLLP